MKTNELGLPSKKEILFLLQNARNGDLNYTTELFLKIEKIINDAIDKVIKNNSYNKNVLHIYCENIILNNLDEKELINARKSYYYILRFLTDYLKLKKEKNPKQSITINSKIFLYLLIKSSKYDNTKLSINEAIIVVISAFELLKTDLYHELIKLKFGYYGKVYSNQDIAQKLNINENIVLNKTNEFIEKINNLLLIEENKKILKPLINTLPKNEIKLPTHNNLKKKRIIFNNYSREEIEKVSKYLSKEEQELVIKKLGPNFDENNILSADEEKDYHKVYCKMSRLLIKIREDKIIMPKRKWFSKYTIGEITDAFIYLPKEEQELVIKKLGPNFNENNKLSFEEEKKFKNNTYSKMQDWLEKKKSGQKLDFSKKLFSKFSKEEIKNVLNYLSKEEQDLVLKKIGPNYNESNKLSLEEEHNFSSIYVKMKNKMKKIRNGELIERKKLFFDYTLEEKEEAFKCLSTKEQELLIKKTGINFNQNNILSEEEEKIVKNIYIKMIKYLRRIKKGERLVPKTKIFSKYTLEEKQQAFNHLPKEEQIIVIRKMGEDFTESNILGKEEEEKFKRIYYKLQRYMDKMRKTAIEKVELPKLKPLNIILNISEEDTIMFVNELSKDDQEKLYKRYGYDLFNPVFHFYDKDLFDEVDYLIINKLKFNIYYKMELNNKVLDSDKLATIIKKIKDDQISTRDILITLMLIGYNFDDKNLLLDLSNDEVKDSAIKVLTKYPMLYDYLLDEKTNETNKTIVKK